MGGHSSTAWFQVFGAFLIFTASWGVVQSFGVFQSFYQSGLLSRYTASQISWIGTIQGSLVIVVGALTGPIFDKGHLPIAMTLGAVMVVLGTMTLSLSTAYYQILLSQGLCVGSGVGLIYVPSLALIASAFDDKWRPWAMGMVTSGTSVGGVIYPLEFRQLQPESGFQWTTKVQGFMTLGSFIVAFPLMLIPRSREGRLQPDTTEKKSFHHLFLDNRAWKEPPFMFYLLANFFIFIGFYIPWFFIPSFAQVALNDSEATGFNILAITHAGGFFGRLLPGYIASQCKWLGAAGTHVLFAFCTAILAFSWMAVQSTPSFIVWCVLWGFFAGAHIALPPAVTSELCPEGDMLGTRIGMVEGISAPAILIGNPVAGTLLDLRGQASRSNFLWVQAYSGGTLLLGALCILPVWRSLANRSPA